MESMKYVPAMRHEGRKLTGTALSVRCMLIAITMTKEKKRAKITKELAKINKRIK
jgi:hypothetical protein